jgi:predicted MFS family arabinose efflux permease
MDRRRGWELLGVTTGAFFVTMVARLAPSPLVPDVMAAFSVSKGQVGLALTGMWAAYALFQFPGGVVADRIGTRRVILSALVGTGVGSLLLAAAPSFALFAVLAVTLGAGAGLYYPSGTAFLTEQFRDTGRALGVHEIGAASAGVVAPTAAVLAANRFGWRAGLLVPTVLAAVVAVLFYLRVPPTPPADPDATLAEQLEVGRLAALLSRPTIVLTALVAMIGYFSFQSFSSFFPTFLVEHVEVTTAQASLAFGGVFVVTVVGAPALGRVSDRLGRDPVMAASMLVGVVAFAVFLTADGLVALVVGTVLLGAGLSWPGVLNSRFMDHLDAGERGTGFGLVRTIVLLMGSLGSVVTGTIADVAGWLPALGLVAGLLGAVVVLLTVNRVFGLGA